MPSSTTPVPFLFGLVDSSTPLVFLLLPLVLLLPFSIFFLFKNSSDGSEPYVFEHIELNRLPGDPKSKKPETEWLNMGYWKDTTIFSEACEALSHLLLSRANLQPLGRTLDVAHATGDSLLLLKSPTSPYPRQAHIVGITSLPEHARRAAVRLAAVYPKRGESIQIICEDAVYRGPKSSGFKKHPLDPTGKKGEEGEEEKFDSVVCLDAAYHFRSRQKWLEQVLQSGLKEGGTVAFTDILSASSPSSSSSSSLEGFTIIPSSTTTNTSSSAEPSWLSRLLLRTILLPLLSVPSSNIVPLSSLGASMVQLGYEDVEIEDITEEVFPGLARFLGGREELSWRLMGRLVRWWSGGEAGGKGLLRFVVVKGRKPKGGKKD